MIRCLIVEDDPLVARALRRVLARHVDVVGVAADASSALAHLDEGTVDIVITDYDLGEGARNGVDLAQDIRDRWPALPIVMVSGSIDTRVRTTALDAGVDACFPKPVPAGALLETLLRLAKR
jgi:DNA-binding NarL/FixJ family response regulator